jgi:hypothetical protein
LLTPGPDATTLATGDAGAPVACGMVEADQLTPSRAADTVAARRFHALCRRGTRKESAARHGRKAARDGGALGLDVMTIQVIEQAGFGLFRTVASRAGLPSWPCTAACTGRWPRR